MNEFEPFGSNNPQKDVNNPFEPQNNATSSSKAEPVQATPTVNMSADPNVVYNQQQNQTTGYPPVNNSPYTTPQQQTQVPNSGAAYGGQQQTSPYGGNQNPYGNTPTYTNTQIPNAYTGNPVNTNPASPYQTTPQPYSAGMPQQASNYTQPVNGQPSWMPPVVVQKKSNPVGVIVTILLVMLVLGGIGFGVWYNMDGVSGNTLKKINNYIANHQDSELESYLSKNKNANLNETSEDLLPPVYQAIYSGNMEALEILLKHGADVNLNDTYGWPSPLFEAVYDEVPEALPILVKYGVKMDVLDDKSRTPLHYAAFLGSTEMYVFLVESGSNEMLLDKNGYNMAHMALFGGSIDFIPYLAERGISLDTATTNGDTLLHIADTDDAVVYVMENYPNIDVNALNAYGNTPLCYNARNSSYAVITLLLAAGADPNIQDSSGATALMYATMNKDTTVINLLLSSGADPTLKDKDGDTAYDYAVMYEASKDVQDALKVENTAGFAA